MVERFVSGKTILGMHLQKAGNPVLGLLRYAFPYLASKAVITRFDGFRSFCTVFAEEWWASREDPIGDYTH